VLPAGYTCLDDIDKNFSKLLYFKIQMNLNIPQLPFHRSFVKHVFNGQKSSRCNNEKTFLPPATRLFPSILASF
jgi:hypothetical protein